MTQEIQVELIRLAGGFLGLLASGFLTLRYYLRVRVKEHEVNAKLQNEVTDAFRKEVSRLDVITHAHGIKLTEMAIQCAELGGKLQLALPEIHDLHAQNPKLLKEIGELHGQVSALVSDFAAARARLKEKAIPGSGGMVKIEHPPKQKEGE